MHISFDYADTFSNNLLATNIKASVESVVTVSLDLNCNLRSRNKEVQSFTEARDLADGEINRLNSLQCDDDRVLNRLRNILGHSDHNHYKWQLVIHLDGEHLFEVNPEYYKEHEYRSLVFRVKSDMINSAS